MCVGDVLIDIKNESSKELKDDEVIDSYNIKNESSKELKDVEVIDGYNIKNVSSKELKDEEVIEGYNMSLVFIDNKDESSRNDQIDSG